MGEGDCAAVDLVLRALARLGERRLVVPKLWAAELLAIGLLVLELMACKGGVLGSKDCEGTELGDSVCLEGEREGGHGGAITGLLLVLLTESMLA